MNSYPTGLYDPNYEKSSCGVGFITRKNSVQSHDILIKAHEALCAVPHRGGMSSEGVGDGAGISIDLSLKFFQNITLKQLIPGYFCVGNFFMPSNKNTCDYAESLIINILKKIIQNMRTAFIGFGQMLGAEKLNQLKHALSQQ